MPGRRLDARQKHMCHQGQSKGKHLVSANVFSSMTRRLAAYGKRAKDVRAPRRPPDCQERAVALGSMNPLRT
jgi:hypothetical protein